MPNHTLSDVFSQEMSLVSAEARGQVNVCVDAAPSMDLNQAINEIRQHYETITEKHREELESWYKSKVKLFEYLANFIIMMTIYFGGIVLCLTTEMFILQ